MGTGENNEKLEYYLNDKTKDNEMGGACDTCEYER